MKRHRSIWSAATVVLACSLVSLASAGQVKLEFSSWYGDSGAPEGSGPWMIATFEDAGADRVLLTIEALLTDAEHAKQINFNLDPVLDADDLSINQLSGGPVAKSVKAETNAFDAGPSFNYDIELKWKRPGDRFEGKEVVQFELLGISGLTAQSFLFLNDANKGPLAYAAAHIGGIGPNDERSSWITPTVVPLPAPVLLVGLGIGALPFVRRRWMRA